jgi:hypothetical protein
MPLIACRRLGNRRFIFIKGDTSLSRLVGSQAQDASNRVCYGAVDPTQRRRLAWQHNNELAARRGITVSCSYPGDGVARALRRQPGFQPRRSITSKKDKAGGGGFRFDRSQIRPRTSSATVGTNKSAMKIKAISMSLAFGCTAVAHAVVAVDIKGRFARCVSIVITAAGRCCRFVNGSQSCAALCFGDYSAAPKSRQLPNDRLLGCAEVTPVTKRCRKRTPLLRST